MTDRAALLRSILAAPDDDAPRLVYADWLDENGEPERAEFIRVQCELARLGPPRRSFEANDGSWAFSRGRASAAILHRSDEPPIQAGELIDISLVDVDDPGRRTKFYGLAVINSQRLTGRGGASETAVDLKQGPFSGPWAGEELRQRERDLLEWHGWQKWQGACWEVIPKGARIPGCIEFRRGFVESVACTAADWIAHADAILAEHPVREVRLTTWPESPHEFVDVSTHSGDRWYVHPQWPSIRFGLPARAADIFAAAAAEARPRFERAIQRALARNGANLRRQSADRLFRRPPQRPRP